MVVEVFYVRSYIIGNENQNVQNRSRPPQQGVQDRMVLVVNFFRFFENIFFCFVVAMFNLMHDVEAIFPLPFLYC